MHSRLTRITALLFAGAGCAPRAQEVEDGHAITWREHAFVADLPSLGRLVRFDASGAVLADGDRVALALHTRAWGRAGALTLLGPREAALGDGTGDGDGAGSYIPRLEYTSPNLTE